MRLPLVVTSLVALVTLAGPVFAGDAPPAPSFELVGGQLVLPGPVEFATGSAEILPESEPALGHVLAYLAAKPAITKIRIESHVDSSAAAASRLDLTKARAAAVARWLVAHGADCKRLLPAGFGDTKPVEDDSTPAGRAANRRTVFVNCEMRGIAIGGMPLDGGGAPAGDPCASE